ncbi:Rcs stress response system protein RcsF [Escherichia coli]
MLSRSPVEPVQSTAPQPESGACKTESAARHAGPNLYQCRRISRKPFCDLGEVSGDSCQASNQDFRRAFTGPADADECLGKMKANAVLLHSCEVTSGTLGCYRQAVCIGSALNITAK